MRSFLSALVLATLALLPAACANGTAQSTPGTQAPKADTLQQLFADSDEDSLKLNPIGALFRGDSRYVGQFGDYISNDYIEQSKRNLDSDWKRLRAIDQTSLSGQDQIAYQVFEYQTRMGREFLESDLIALSIVRPINHFNGLHTQYPDINSGKSAAQYKTVADYENGLTRMEGFATYLDRCIVRMKEGLKTGVVETKLTVKQMITQFDDLIAQGVEKSPFWQPASLFPDTISKPDRMRLGAAYRAMLEQKLIPSYTRVRTFLKNTYLAKARRGVGLVYMRGGKKLYSYLTRQETTTNLTPTEIHAMGLKEVSRIKDEMEAVRKSVGFKGNLHAFFEHLRTAKEYEPSSKQDLQDRYAEIANRVDAAIPALFALKPKTPLELRAVPDYLEQSQAAGYYNQGAPDASRPGTFFFNTYDLPSRKVWGMETLYLHEAIPGHHFQISLAQENEALPNFMRFGGNTAYVEGWALYAEWLGREMGMYKDPYQKFGHLNDEQLRALRLVVDTGIHAKGWTREHAIKFMLDNSALSVTETTQEVDRYIANPGQALGYKVGQLTIKRLRAKAEAALGTRFQIADFHAQVLNTGALPLEILETKIDNWLKTSK